MSEETDVQERLGSDFDKGYVPEAFQFEKIDFTTFKAEYTWRGDDLILHFWPPDEHKEGGYWHHRFPNCLSEVAEDYFDASYPRLKAAYSEELGSWWMKASNFTSINPEKFAEGFLDKLDDRLEVP